uniref:Perlucin n=2 Tax=Zeugodacus cucurbitae TaxID=28588 RepID=A0A0A1WKJ8_ZEUCU
MNALSFYLTTNDGHIGKYFWLGVSDLADEGKFMSHTDGRPMPYAKWSGGQPDDAGKNEDCVHLWAINNVFHMNDNVCTAMAYAICELRQRSKSCDVCDLKHFMERLVQSTNAFKCQN